MYIVENLGNISNTLQISFYCWKKEYLQSLQEHQKWEGKKRNFKIGDVVIIYHLNVSKNHWPMARIIDVNSKKGLVCCVLLCMEELSGNKNSKYDLEQPTDKIMLILENVEVQLPTEKAKQQDKTSYLKGIIVTLDHKGVCTVNFACERELNWLDFKNMSCFENKSFKLRVINTVIYFK